MRLSILKRARVSALLLVVVLLASCSVAPVVKENSVITVKDISVTSPVRFSQFGDGRSRFWTLDGLMLNDFRIYADIKPGETLFLSYRSRAERRGEGILFKKSMSELELQELFVDALESSGAKAVSASNLRPAKFGTRQGMRFELQYQTPSGGSSTGGLIYQTMVLAETEGDTLSYLLFDAPKEYFFARDQAVVESIFASVRTAN